MAPTKFWGYFRLGIEMKRKKIFLSNPHIEMIVFLPSLLRCLLLQVISSFSLSQTVEWASCQTLRIFWESKHNRNTDKYRTQDTGQRTIVQRDFLWSVATTTSKYYKVVKTRFEVIGKSQYHKQNREQGLRCDILWHAIFIFFTFQVFHLEYQVALDVNISCSSDGWNETKLNDGMMVWILE